MPERKRVPRGQTNTVGSALPKQETETKEQKIRSHFVPIHKYRHLILNLRRRADEPPSPIAGSREAGVLSRLWVLHDLGLKPRLQKEIGFDLGMGSADIGRILKKFLKLGLVKRVPVSSDREKHYEITEQGDIELTHWIRRKYAPPSYYRAFVDMNPDMKKMESLLDALRIDLRTILDPKQKPEREIGE